MMNVAELMTRDPKRCGPEDSLNRAAELMWEFDCGCLPVVDEGGRLCGVITDRDVCMAAYTQGGTLVSLSVAGAMSKRGPVACSPDSSVEEAEKMMCEHQIRRLPVTDKSGRLVGILSLADFAGEAASRRRKRGTTAARVGNLVVAITTASSPAVAA